MPLQKLSFDDFSDKTEMIICLRDHHNQLVDYCNELERRLAEVEKKPSYSGQVIYPSNATPPCTCSVTTVGHQPNCPRNPKNWKVTS